MSTADLFASNYDAANRFLAALDFNGDGEDSLFQWQTFVEVKGARDDDDDYRRLTRTPFGSLRECWPELSSLNRNQGGIHVQVHQTDGHGRTDHNVVMPRAVFVDFDNGSAPPGTGACPPTMLIRSVRGEHVYWCLEEGESLAEWHRVQRAIAMRLQSDESATKLCQTMRCPGFAHWKTGSPRNITIRADVYHPDRRYTLARIVELFSLEPELGKVAASDAEAERLRLEAQKYKPKRPLHLYTDKLDRARRFVDQIPGVGDGSRNEHMARKIAPVGWDFGIDVDDWTAEAQAYNHSRNNPPLRDKEVEHTVRSVYRSGDRGKLGNPFGYRLEQDSPEYVARRQAHEKRRDQEDAAWWDRVLAESDEVGVAQAREVPVTGVPSPVSFRDLADFKYRATVPVPDGHPLSLRGNSGRFIDQWTHQVRWCPPLERWYLWCGTHWEHDKYGGVCNLAQQTLARIHGLMDHEDVAPTPDEKVPKEITAVVAERQASRRPGADMSVSADDPQAYKDFVLNERRKEKLRSDIAKHCLRSEDPTGLEKMLKYASWQRCVIVRPDDLDRDDFLVNTPNGVIDIRTKRLRPHEPSLYQTKITSTSYRPQAQCGRWMDFLNWAMCDDPEMVAFLQRAAGYSLTGSARDQCFFICFGVGGNGKSTFLTALMELARSYARTCDFNMFLSNGDNRVNQPNEEMLALKDVRLAYAAEPEAGRALREDTIKHITGGEKVSVRPLWGKPIEFAPKFSLWFSSNHRPTIKGTDEGIWRRVHMIPWKARIAEQDKDPNLAHKLRAEYEGILRWMIDGANEWYHNGLQVPEKVRAATREYRDDMDVLGSFIESCCVEGETNRAGSSELYEAYTKWCDKNGERPFKQKTFSQRLAERGYAKKKTKKGNVFLGIGIWEARGDDIDQTGNYYR